VRAGIGGCGGYTTPRLLLLLLLLVVLRCCAPLRGYR